MIESPKNGRELSADLGEASVGEMEGDRGAKLACEVLGGVARGWVAELFTPNRVWKAGVERPSRNHVPVHMRSHIPQARHVDLVGIDRAEDGGLGCEDEVH